VDDGKAMEEDRGRKERQSGPKEKPPGPGKLLNKDHGSRKTAVTGRRVERGREKTEWGEGGGKASGTGETIKEMTDWKGH